MSCLCYMKIDNNIETKLLRKEIGARIANCRILAHIKQSELAERSGISRCCLSRLENGVGGVSFDSVLEVMRQLKMLPSLNLTFPEPTIPLHELVEKEKKARITLPARVRSRKENPSINIGRPKWGDEQEGN